MQLFQNLDSTSFSYNGDRYVKNFIVLKVGSTNISVINAYDTALQLLPSIHYSEVRVNGNSYGTQALLMNELANVVFAKTASSATINQNNVGYYITQYQYVFTTPSDTLTASEVAAKINSTISFGVSEVQSPVIFQFVRNALQSGSSTPIQKKYLYLFTGGKGSYGLLQTSVSSSQFKLLDTSTLNPQDLEDDDTAEINYLGEIPDGDYVSVANESEWDFFDTEVTHYFSYTTDGVLYYVVFIGEAGLYGGENQQFTEDDFIDSTNSDALPYIPTLQEIITQGSTATTANNISLNTTGTGKLLYNGSEVLNTAKIGVANGIVPTDGANKIPVAYLPNAVMIYKGVWNLATNTPALSDGSGTTGWVYKVTGAPTPTNFNFGSGNIQLTNGDYVIYSDGGKWEKSDGSDAVTSVNGYQGVVDLTYTDVDAAAAVHTHAISDVTGLTSALDSKANVNGSNATGNWPIDISGLAAVASKVRTTAGDALFHWENGVSAGVPPTWIWGGQNPTDFYVFGPNTITANATNVVHTTGNETIANTKDFTGTLNVSGLLNVDGSVVMQNTRPIYFNGTDWALAYSSSYSGMNLTKVGVLDGVIFAKDNLNVGIRNANPQYGLDIDGTTRTTGVARFENNIDINGNNYIGFNSNTWTVNHGSGGLNFTKQGTGNALFLKDDLKVGIGTNNPQTKLDVWDNASNDLIAGRVGSLGVQAFTIGGYNTDLSNAGLTIKTQKAGSMTEAVRVTYDGNVEVGGVLPLTLYHNQSEASRVNGLYYTTDNSGYQFGIGKIVSGTKTDQITIQDNGRVGIGTVSPTAKLDVAGTGRIQGALRIGTDTVNSLQTRLEIQNDSGAAYLWAVSNGIPAISQAYFGILNLSAGTSPFIIDGATGNIGLNSLPSSTKLSIANGTGGNQLELLRGVGRVLFGQADNTHNLILYGGASGSEVAYQRWHQSGNVTIGGGADIGYKLDVEGASRLQGEVRVTGALECLGEVTVPNATVSTSAVNKGQLDAAISTVNTNVLHTTGNEVKTGGTTAFIDKVAIGTSSISAPSAKFTVSGSTDLFGVLNTSGAASFGGEVLVYTPSGVSPYAAVNIDFLDTKLNGLPQILNNTTVSALSNSALNAAYPSVAVGTQIVCGSVGTGVIYVKINTTGGGTWRQMYLNSL